MVAARLQLVKVTLVTTEKVTAYLLIFCNVAFKSQNCTKTVWDAVIKPTNTIILHNHSCSCYRSLQLLDASDCVNVLLQYVFKSEPYVFSDV